MSIYALYLVSCLVLLVASVSDAFCPGPRNVFVAKPSKLFGIMDALNKAMANQPGLPPAKNPGLSKDPTFVTVEFLPSKKTTKAILGQKFKDIANTARVQIPYACEKGECGTCSVKFNGKVVKACQVSLPSTSKETNFQIEVLKAGSFPVKIVKAGKLGNL